MMFSFLSTLVLALNVGGVSLFESECQAVLFVHPIAEEPVAVCAQRLDPVAEIGDRAGVSRMPA